MEVREKHVRIDFKTLFVAICLHAVAIKGFVC